MIDDFMPDGGFVVLGITKKNIIPFRDNAVTTLSRFWDNAVTTLSRFWDNAVTTLSRFGIMPLQHYPEIKISHIITSKTK